MTALARLDLRLAPRGAPAPDAGAAPEAQPYSVAQAKALQAVGKALRPEDADLESAVRASAFSEATPTADDLRLPPPPVVAGAGPELLRATLRAVDAFRSQRPSPPGADAAALQAEGRMMALLDGIDRLKLEISDRARARVLS